jgi:hypothetical protein
MADIRNTSNKGFADIAGSVKAERTFGGEVRVHVGGSLFERYNRKLYRAMAYAHSNTTMTATLPFTEDEFVLYAYDALHVRVQRVLREPASLPFQGWALPAPLASMLAALGEVTKEAPFVRVIPVWDRGIAWGHTRQTWNNLTMRIRSVEHSINVLLVDTIEREPKGDKALMLLLPMERAHDESETVIVDSLGNEVSPLVIDRTAVEALYGYEPVDAISAATYLALGMYPEVPVDPTLGHPLSLPGYFISREPAMLVVERLTQVKSA